jgi:hypothetical protein
LIGVLVDRAVIVPPPQVLYHVIKLIHFGVHHAQVGHQANLIDV